MNSQNDCWMMWLKSIKAEIILLLLSLNATSTQSGVRVGSKFQIRNNRWILGQLRRKDYSIGIFAYYMSTEIFVGQFQVWKNKEKHKRWKMICAHVSIKKINNACQQKQPRIFSCSFRVLFLVKTSTFLYNTKYQ